jgi:fatty-acyl-CoA synthase
VTDRFADTVYAARVLRRSGVLAPDRPGRLLGAARALRHWGATLGGAFASGAARFGDRAAIEDELGTVTYAQLDARSDALARGLAATGVRGGDAVAVLCRNHRYFLEVTAALAKLGADALYLNTGFSAPQIHDVMVRERARTLIHDDEFGPLAQAAEVESALLAWCEGTPREARTVEELIQRHRLGASLTRPGRTPRTIILTSGTTGTPKGAAREQRAGAATAVALLDRIPYQARETMVVAAPCFHAWGFGNAVAGLLLGNTLVLERFFDPERTLAALARHRAEVLVAVPVMLARLLDVPPATRRAHDTSCLRLVPLSGSALPGDLAPRFMDAFGDVVYNLYGSTEVGYVSIAAPDDLRAAPSTAGRPPRGTEIRLLDERDRPVAAGATGRIYVRSPLVFDGYTDGASRQSVDGFMRTGDTGHLDADGRLFVDGRDDDMIITGGENVFPSEVENVLLGHPDVADVAVIGVPDAEFGRRLKAFVVPASGASPDASALREHVRARLARFMVPREIAFVDELPRNATGKIVKRDLS